MADNIAVTAGSGTTVGTDERTVNSVAVQVQRVGVQCGTAFATGQVVPTATAATLVAARDTRQVLTIFNGTNLTIWVGPATVTTANGFEVRAGAGLDISTQALVQVIVASVTGLAGAVSYLEVHDA